MRGNIGGTLQGKDWEMHSKGKYRRISVEGNIGEEEIFGEPGKVEYLENLARGIFWEPFEARGIFGGNLVRGNI